MARQVLVLQLIAVLVLVVTALALATYDARMGAAAQRRVLERYTERRILPILDNAYQQAMRTSGWVQRAERERRVDGEHHLLHRGGRVTRHQPDRVPRVGGAGRVPGVQQVDDVGKGGHAAQYRAGAS